MSELIRFRCNRCNASLKVSGAKSGAKVACPKCGLELSVPSPAAVTVEQGAYPQGEESPLAEFVVGSPGVRVELAGAESQLATPTVGADRTSGGFGRGLDHVPANINDAPSEFLNLALRLEPEPTTEVKPASRPSVPVVTAAPAVGPGVKTEAPSDSQSLRPEKISLRTRDVTLPRTAVVAWTTFALLAQVFALLAGLLVGHFLWR